MRIAVSSSSFRLPLASGALTQLEWVERCASVLGVDGILADVADFPRSDAEYVAQIRKVAIDLALVPFGIDAPALLDLAAEPSMREAALTLATGFGAAVVRTVLPPPGDVPSATFVEAVAAAKAVSRLAKAANVTVLIAPAPGTLGEDVASVKHLLKDVDSAWLRTSPPALADRSAFGSKDRIPAFVATNEDDPAVVAVAAERAWVIVDAAPSDRPWDDVGIAIEALRDAAAHQRRAVRR